MGSHSDKRPAVPASVLSAFGLEPGSLERIAGGHINLTFLARADSGERRVLQRVNPIFPPEVNLDLDAVTAHLSAKGLRSPALLRTMSGELWVEDAKGCWRLQSFVEGESTETVASPEQAVEAGRLLGRFHAELADLEHVFRSVRSDPHETARHLAALESALDQHPDHPDRKEIEPLADAILHAGSRITELPQSPQRVVHGDPKISNVIFDRETGSAICFVDLDTLGRRTVVTELGDAFRSWCNPAGEDSASATFSAGLFAAAISGYAAGSSGLLTDVELSSIPAATYAIAVELAARFCADALNESFFRWDPGRFPTASAHNRARARAQLGVALAAAAAEADMRAAIDRVFGRTA